MDPSLAKQEKTEDMEISLRPFDLSDIDDFMVWTTDARVARFCRWDAYTSKEAVLERLKERIIPHPWYRAICLDNRPIGAISITPGSDNDRCRAALGYVIGFQHWGKGIATRAVKMAVGSIFREWPHLERLEAVVDVENPGSERVLEKAGFVREGLLRKYFILKGKARDVVMYSFLSTDPMPSE
ncbi:uncharacterized protein LOC131219515 [Magnolia sinica]|uniref:uncharacterized protein LOC131219515 n=1 Tax=Magnolia sinica TaxID=86752 RepID=UPI00265831A7|nr:uncharacterized protein LOC131219515 [Magnolia sinica]